MSQPRAKASTAFPFLWYRCSVHVLLVGVLLGACSVPSSPPQVPAVSAVPPASTIGTGSLEGMRLQGQLENASTSSLMPASSPLNSARSGKRQDPAPNYELLPQLFGGIGASRYGFGFDRDAQRILVEEFGEISFWETDSGRRAGSVPMDTGGARSPGVHLTTGSNGTILGAYQHSGDYKGATYRVFVWNTADDTLVRQVDIPMPYLGPGWTVSLSQRGSHVAFGGDQRVVLYDFKTRATRELEVWPPDKKRYDVEFVDDEQLLVRCFEGFERELVGTALIQAASRQVLWKLPVAVAVGADAKGPLFAVASEGSIQLRRAIQGPLLTTLPSTRPVRFTPDGTLLLANSVEHGASLWNTATGARLCRLEDTLGAPYEGQFSPDSRLYAWDRGGLGIWEVATGRRLRVIKNQTKHVSKVVFTPDGEHLALIGDPSSAIELSSLSLLDPMEAARYEFLGPEGNPYRKLHLQRDGNSFPPVWHYAEDKFHGKGNYDLSLFVGETGELVHTFHGQHYGAYGTAWDVHPNKPWIALSSSHENHVRFYDTRTWQEVGRFETDGPSKWIDLHPTLPLLVTLSDRAIASLYNIETGACLKLLLGDDGEWIVYAEDGTFGGSKRAGRLVSVFDGQRAYSIDQFGLSWNRPDLLLERLNLGESALRKHFANRANRRLSKAGVSAADTRGDLAPPSAEITAFAQTGKFATVDFQFAARKGSLSTYQIYVNDVPLFGPEGKELRDKAVEGSERIELVSGNNKIELSCRDSRGQESLRALRQVLYAEPVVGDLYFLGFGASEYADSRLNLQYAHKDALDLQALFRSLSAEQTAGGFREVHTRVLTNAQVTRAALEACAEFLEPADVDDTVVLFIAGHGVHTEDENNTYYYLTHDTNLDDIAGSAAPFTVIESLLHGIAPRRKLFLMDTCESGEVDPELEARTTLATGARGLVARTAQRGLTVVKREESKSGTAGPRKWLWHRDRFLYNDLLRRSGAIVFSSSRGGEYSYESAEVENGFFTEALLAALGEGRADKDNDAWVTSVELQKYVTADVTDRTASAQNPTIDRDNLDVVLRFPRAGAAARPAWWDEPLTLRPAEQAGPGTSPAGELPLATQSLQTLIDATPDGGTLRLERARYESALPIYIKQRRDLTIVGVPGTTIVNNTNAEIILGIESSFGIRIQNVSAFHATIESCTAGVVDIYDSQFVRIEDSELNGCGTVGIYALNVDHLDVIHCHIHNNRDCGFYLASNLPGLRLLGNHLHDNGKTFSGGVPEGIEARGNVARGVPWNLGE